MAIILSIGWDVDVIGQARDDFRGTLEATLDKESTASVRNGAVMFDERWQTERSKFRENVFLN